MAFEWLTQNSRNFLSAGYLTGDETAEQRIWDIAVNAENILNIEGFAEKFYDYMGKGWISLSTPVWTNFGKERGMPISCFGSYIGDSISEISYASSEVALMSKLGGGTSGYFGDIRGRGSDISDNGYTSGSVHFMELFQSITDVVSQGSARRGRMATYLPLRHYDAEEFLDIGTEGHPIQSMTTGVTVDDEWFKNMMDGNSENRKLWAKTLRRRSEVGFPYIMFEDNINRNRPQVYKDKGMKIKNSNLCSEIALPVNEMESFVCVLSSINLKHYDEWKDTDLIETMIYFLDATITEFLQKLESRKNSEDHQDRLTFDFMERAYNFAKNHRALGLGVLGWHSYLQSNMISFDSQEAMEKTDEIFSLMDEKSHKATKELAERFGEPSVLRGYGERNTTRLAIAPTTSSAFILGQVSQSIEPLMSNYYIKDLAKLKAEIKNPYLKAILKERGYDNADVWDSIAEKDGSVQHLTHILSDQERDVFKTFREIDMYAIINQAAIRQEYLDQTQSLNLMIDNNYSPKDINGLMIHAWEMGICTLYYQHSVNAAQEFSRKETASNCVSCEA